MWTRYPLCIELLHFYITAAISQKRTESGSNVWIGLGHVSSQDVYFENAP